MRLYNTRLFSQIVRDGKWSECICIMCIRVISHDEVQWSRLVEVS